MKNKLLCVYLACAIILPASLGQCADVSFKTDGEFGNWSTFYYQNPSPERVPIALAYFCSSSLYKTNANIPMVAFFSALFKKDAGLMQKTFDEISSAGSQDAKAMLINILFLTNSPESKSLLEKAKNAWQPDQLRDIIVRQLASSPGDLSIMPINSPLMLDMLWAAFYATGEDWPIQRIIAVLHLLKDGHGEDMMLGGAANWSLTSNAEQHPRVREICKQTLLNAHGVTKDLLEKIVH